MTKSVLVFWKYYIFNSHQEVLHTSVFFSVFDLMIYCYISFCVYSSSKWDGKRYFMLIKCRYYSLVLAFVFVYPVYFVMIKLFTQLNHLPSHINLTRATFELTTFRLTRHSYVVRPQGLWFDSDYCYLLKEA